jgi:hypothetical protein
MVLRRLPHTPKDGTRLFGLDLIALSDTVSFARNLHSAPKSDSGTWSTEIQISY